MATPALVGSFLGGLATAGTVTYVSDFIGGWASIWLRRRSRDHVPSMAGKVAVVTGGNAGIGFGTGKAFAAAGASVVLCSRNQQRGEEAKAAILREQSDAKVEVMIVDVANYTSVVDFASSLQTKHDRIDVLVLNAGMSKSVTGSRGFEKTAEGFELMMQTNFLGHFLLVGCLRPLLRASPGCRVITHSSVAASNSYRRGVDPKTWKERPSDFSDWMQYGQTKLCLALMAQELQRLEPDLISVACHPGVVNGTGLLGNYGCIEWFYQTGLLWPMSMKLADGNRNTVYLATTGDALKGGRTYYPVGRVGSNSVGWFQRMGALQLPLPMSESGDNDNGAAAKRVWLAAEEAIQEWKAAAAA